MRLWKFGSQRGECYQYAFIRIKLTQKANWSWQIFRSHFPFDSHFPLFPFVPPTVIQWVLIRCAIAMWKNWCTNWNDTMKTIKINDERNGRRENVPFLRLIIVIIISSFTLFVSFLSFCFVFRSTLAEFTPLKCRWLIDAEIVWHFNQWQHNVSTERCEKLSWRARGWHNFCVRFSVR